jgi:hypothetical protein
MADEQNNWEYKTAADGSSEQQAQQAASQPVAWTANEFIAHERGTGWYILLLVGTVIVAAAMYLLIKDYFATGAILVVGIITAVYTNHKPQNLAYELSTTALTIGNKTYNYNMFKSFSIIYEGEHASIHLEPVKRYMPPMTVYFPPEKENIITETIGNYLPFQERQQNLTDRLAHRFKL